MCVMHAAQPRGLTMPVAATPKLRTLSAPERLSTSLPSGYDYLSLDGLSEKHRVPSTVSMTSLCSPTHGKYIYI